MSSPLIVRPEADVDLRQAYEFLKKSRPELAGRFLVEVRGLRAARLKKLRYIVYYVRSLTGSRS